MRPACAYALVVLSLLGRLPFFQPARDAAAKNVAEVNWHKTQRIRWDDDGAVFFSCTVDGLDEIAWWVLGYGPEVEVLKPADLRRRIADMAARMAKLYKSG